MVINLIINTCQVLILTPDRVFWNEMSWTIMFETQATLLSFPSPPRLWYEKNLVQNQNQKIPSLKFKLRITITTTYLMPWPGPQLIWWTWTLEQPVCMDTQSSPVKKRNNLEFNTQSPGKMLSLFFLCWSYTRIFLLFRSHDSVKFYHSKEFQFLFAVQVRVRNAICS